MSDPKRRFRLSSVGDGGHVIDPLGGPVSSGNAAITMMTVACDGEPSLDELAVGEVQHRRGTTADAQVRGKKRRASDSAAMVSIVYSVVRVEDADGPDLS